MSTNTCKVCRQESVHWDCGVCAGSLCKKCAQYLDIETFSFQEKVPEEFTRGHYCPDCFEAKIEPALAEYNAMMERAKTVHIFFDTSPLPRSLIKKAREGISVPACKDRDETFMRLGFRALERGFNAVVEVEVDRKRARHIWEGCGIPANIDLAKQARFELNQD